MKLCDELPVAEGTIVHVRGERVITDLGQDSRIKKGMRCIIYREGEPLRHPTTGALLGADAEQLARCVIQNVMDTTSEVALVEKGATERIQPAFRVITQ